MKMYELISRTVQLTDSQTKWWVSISVYAWRIL